MVRSDRQEISTKSILFHMTSSSSTAAGSTRCRHFSVRPRGPRKYFLRYAISVFDRFIMIEISTYYQATYRLTIQPAECTCTSGIISKIPGRPRGRVDLPGVVRPHCGCRQSPVRAERVTRCHAEIKAIIGRATPRDPKITLFIDRGLLLNPLAR